MPRKQCALTVCIIPPLTQAQLNSFLNDMKGYVLGRAASGGPGTDYGVLAFGGVAVTVPRPKDGALEEVPVTAIFGVRADTPKNVEARIEAVIGVSNTWVSRMSFSTGRDQAFMDAAMKARAANELGCSNIWQVTPLSDVTTGVTDGASLLAKFVPAF